MEVVGRVRTLRSTWTINAQENGDVFKVKGYNSHAPNFTRIILTSKVRIKRR